MAAFEVYLRSAWQVRPGFSLERVQHSGISFWSGGTGLARNFAAPALAPKRWGLFLQWAGAMWHLTNSEVVILGALDALVLALAPWRDR